MRCDPQLRDVLIAFENDADTNQTMLFPMIDLPTLELKAEREELIGFMARPFRCQPNFQKTKHLMTMFVNQRGTRSVMDCLSVIRA